MNKIINKNIKLFEKNYLSTNDVLLVPSTGIVNSRKDIKVDDAFIFSSPMDTVISNSLIVEMLKTNQVPVSCRFDSYSSRFSQLTTFHKHENYWFSVGANKKDFDLLISWLQENKEAKLNISVDVAHGDTKALHKIYKLYSKQEWCKNLMSGTIATSKSAINVFNAGCNYLRVGIGPGSACSTRIVTGCGVPNLSAIFNIWNTFQDPIYSKKPFIIADGGIKTSGDIAKYLSAGADGVMIGNLLSKTEESAGWNISSLYYYLSLLTLNFFFTNKIYYKRYRGQASKAFQIARRGSVSGTPEGVEGPIQYPEYTYLQFYNSTVNALRSTISYIGGDSLKSLNPNNVEIISITQNSLLESKPHLLY